VSVVVNLTLCGIHRDSQNAASAAHVSAGGSLVRALGAADAVSRLFVQRTRHRAVGRAPLQHDEPLLSPERCPTGCAQANTCLLQFNIEHYNCTHNPSECKSEKHSTSAFMGSTYSTAAYQDSLTCCARSKPGVCIPPAVPHDRSPHRPWHPRTLTSERHRTRSWTRCWPER
jgi:hypothetical protein